MKKIIVFMVCAVLFGFYNQNLTNFVLFIPETTSQIIIEKGDITKSKVDIIVNAANQELAGGAGVCGAIFKAAGWDRLQIACNQYPVKGSVRCSTGEARVTDSFDLKKNGIKYIIHAVGPDCRVIKDSFLQDELLKKAYINSLKLAETLSVKSVAFPFISSAIYAFPKDCAALIAVHSVQQYFQQYKNSNIKSVHFVLFSQDDFDLFCKQVGTVIPQEKYIVNENNSMFFRIAQFLKKLLGR